MKKLICAVTVLAVSTAQAGVVIHVDASNWPLTGGTSKGGPGGGSRDAAGRRRARPGATHPHWVESHRTAVWHTAVHRCTLMSSRTVGAAAARDGCQRRSQCGLLRGKEAQRCRTITK